MPKAKNSKQDVLLDSWGRSGNRKHADKICPHCGKTFKPLHANSKYCSRKCMWANNGKRGKKKECWWKNGRGYIEGKVLLEDGTQIRVKQHRWVMERILNRPLLRHEDVHHIDGNKTNNDPSNLKIISHGYHTTITNASRTYLKGYKLNLTDEDRKAKSLRAMSIGLGAMGRSAIAKARGER